MWNIVSFDFFFFLILGRKLQFPTRKQKLMDELDEYITHRLSEVKKFASYKFCK